MPESHYPECLATDCGCEKGEECGPRCIHTCICAALHACEQRVSERWFLMLLRGGYRRIFIKGHIEGHHMGKADYQASLELWNEKKKIRDAALDAARNAVAAIPHWDEDCGESLFRACDKDDALAAIDALREEPK